MIFKIAFMLLLLFNNYNNNIINNNNIIFVHGGKIIINECQILKCENNADCILLPSAVELCLCPEGFFGKHCELTQTTNKPSDELVIAPAEIIIGKSIFEKQLEGIIDEKEKSLEFDEILDLTNDKKTSSTTIPTTTTTTTTTTTSSSPSSVFTSTIPLKSTTTTTTITNTNVKTTNQTNNENTVDTAAIVGGAVGVVAAFGLVSMAGVIVIRRKRKGDKNSKNFDFENNFEQELDFNNIDSDIEEFNALDSSTSNVVSENVYNDNSKFIEDNE
eukprot:Pgem_evm1s4081